jgi:5-bromo-4-chloroindolyl phosphate hydrolysis protein
MTNQPDVDRLERAARNQSLFREVNERLEDLATTFQELAGTTMFACECADLRCVEKVELTLDEYERVRAEPNQFIVLAGHVYSDVESVVHETDRFVVVAKVGEAAKVAAEADPRS